MKKYLLHFITFLFINNAFTQNTFPTTTGSKVGIGTTSPQTRLDFRGDNQSISVTGNSFNYASTGTQFPIGAKFGYWTSTGAAGINFHRWLGGGTLFHTAYIGQALNGVNDYGLDFRTENKTTFGDATISRMFISAINGNIGIGTIAPTSKLEINSIINSSGLKFTNLKSTFATTTSSGGKVLTVNSTGDVILAVDGGTILSTIYLSSYSTIEAAIDDLNNNVNVGTLVVDTSKTLSTNKVIDINNNLNKTIKFLNGNKITINNGITFTINAVIEAENQQIFDTMITGKVEGNPKIKYALPQWWKSPTNTNWNKSIQNAVNFYPRVYFPVGTYNVTETINLKNIFTHYLFGEGKNSIITNLTNTFIFKLNSDGMNTGGGTFENLTFNCANGIQINETDVAFDDVSLSPFAGPAYIINTKITKCNFNGTGNGTAILFNKVYDSEISNNQISNFNIGVNLRGSDINSISNNRIASFKQYAILDESFNTLGSENNIYHNDLLVYNGEEGSGAFIKSSSHHIMIKDNYLENTPPGSNGATKVKAFIDCSNYGLENDPTNNNYTKNIDIRGNRIDAHPGSTDNIYLIQDRFSSLILDGHRTTNDTDFPSYFINSAGNPLSYLGSRFNDLCEREIHISSCISFREWNNFNSSNKFTNSSDGTLIIDSKNVSTSIRIDGSPTEVKQFNPIKFKLDATKVYRVNLSQGILNGETELYKNVKFRIILKGTSSSQNGTLLIRADDSDSVINPVAYYNTPTLTNDYSIIEYTPSLQSFAKYLFILSENDIEIKQIEIVPIITPITNKLSKNEEQTINEKFEILEKKLDLLKNELEILKSDSNNIGSNEEIKIFPNPVGDDLSITFSSENSVAFEFSVYDLSGKQVIFEKINYKSKTYHIDFSNLITESYIYKIKSDKYLKTGVIIKK